jgi:hypothetical protein
MSGTQVSQQLEELEKQVVRIRSSVSALMGNLEPVLRAHDTAECGSPKAPASLVPLAMEVQNLADNLATSAGDIESVLERLEL